MPSNTKIIQQLREETGFGVMDCKKALEETDGHLEKAKELLMRKGLKKAGQKESRQTREGVIGVYLHANKKVAGMVALACETDFVARTEEFQNLAHDLAMQVVAASPSYLDPESIPVDTMEKEKNFIKQELKKQRKPANIIEKIMQGKLNKYYQEVCLTKQLFIKDDKKTIDDLIKEYVVKLGENIKIKDFKKLSL